jgi:hypothetical protein
MRSKRDQYWELGVRYYTVVYILDVYIEAYPHKLRNQVVKLQPQVATINACRTNFKYTEFIGAFSEVP